MSMNVQVLKQKCSMNKTYTRSIHACAWRSALDGTDRNANIKNESRGSKTSLSKRWCTWFTGEGSRGVICKDDGHGLPLCVTRQSCDVLHITNLCHLCVKGNQCNYEVVTEPSYSERIHLHHLKRHLCSLNHLIYLSRSIAGCGSSRVQ